MINCFGKYLVIWLWRKAKKISDWILDYQDFSESWWQFVPDFDFVVYDFSLESDTEIVGDAKLQAYLRLVKAIREPNEDELLKNIARIWYIIGLDAADYFETLLIYIVNELDNISLERLACTLNEEGWKIVMTTAERLRMEGREQGREEGREQAVHDMAIRLLAIGMEMDQVAYATELSVEEVEQISKGMDKK